MQSWTRRTGPPKVGSIATFVVTKSTVGEKLRITSCVQDTGGGERIDRIKIVIGILLQEVLLSHGARLIVIGARVKKTIYCL